MRLFVAIQLSDSVKQALTALQENFRAKGVRGNYTSEENLHLTLAFIGDYPDPNEVLEVMKTVTFEPIRLEFSGVGSFHDLWWAGIRENPELQALVKKLRRSLADAGIPFDRKKFRPHITLVRRPVIRGRHGSAAELLETLTEESAVLSGQRAGREIFPPAMQEGTCFFPPAVMQADRISLMLSTRGRHGMIYTELGAQLAE